MNASNLPLPKFTILVADDDTAILLLLQHAFKNEGYRVLQAKNGEEALQIFQEQKPHLVLLDAMMPVLSGFEACTQLRNMPGNDALPILMITGLNDDESVTRAFAAGSTDFITKPLVISVLRHRIRHLLHAYQVEQTLRESEERYRSVVTALEEGIILYDANGMAVTGNASAERILGQSIKQFQENLLRGQTFSFVHEDETPFDKNEHPVLRTLRTGERHSNVVMGIKSKNQNTTWISVNTQPLFHWEETQPYAAVASFRDITERKKTQEELRLNEARYRAILEDQTELICRFLPDCTLTFVNEAYCRYFEKSREELLGVSFKDFLPEEERDSLDRHLATLTKENPTKTYEHSVVGPSGEILWQRWTDHAIFNSDGKVVEFQSVGVDITQQKLAEKRVARESERAAALLRVAARLNAQLDLQAVLSTVCQEITRALNIQAATVNLYDETNHALFSAADFGLPPDYQLRHHPIPMSEYKKYTNGASKNYVVTKVQKGNSGSNFEMYKSLDMQSVASVRMTREGVLIGIVNAIAIGNTREFSEDELSLLQGLADQAALAIANARLLDQVQSYNQELEQRVQARTSELRQINEQLRNEINERLRAQEALQESETKLRVIMSQIPAILWTTDIKLEINSSLGNGLERIGYFAEVPQNTTLFDHMLLYGVAQTSLNEHLRVLEGQSVHFERSYKNHYLDIRVDPLRDSQNQIVGTIGLAVDITGRKNAEEEIRRALEKEKELSGLKSRFISMTSHEFRTPLSTIISSADLLEYYLTTWPPEKMLEHLHRIQSATLTMTQLLNDVLIIGRAEVGKLEFSPTEINLISLCENLIEEAQQLDRNNHLIKFSHSGKQKGVILDEKLMRQALENLLSNAIKYSPYGGKIELHLSFQKGETVFMVRDCGIGIPQEDQYSLFEIFHRGRNVGNIPGTGLGLAIVKKALDAHRATIHFESKVDAGTTFTIRIPQQEKVDINYEYII